MESDEEDDTLESYIEFIQKLEKKLLCGAEFLKQHEYLQKVKKLHIYYNNRLYRPHKTSPFDFVRIRREHFKDTGTELNMAPHYDEDTDPIYWGCYK